MRGWIPKGTLSEDSYLLSMLRIPSLRYLLEVDEPEVLAFQHFRDGKPEVLASPNFDNGIARSVRILKPQRKMKSKEFTVKNLRRILQRAEGGIIKI